VQESRDSSRWSHSRSGSHHPQIFTDSRIIWAGLLVAQTAFLWLFHVFLGCFANICSVNCSKILTFLLIFTRKIKIDDISFLKEYLLMQVIIRFQRYFEIVCRCLVGWFWDKWINFFNIYVLFTCEQRICKKI